MQPPAGRHQRDCPRQCTSSGSGAQFDCIPFADVGVAIRTGCLAGTIPVAPASCSWPQVSRGHVRAGLRHCRATDLYPPGLAGGGAGLRARSLATEPLATRPARIRKAAEQVPAMSRRMPPATGRAVIPRTRYEVRFATGTRASPAGEAEDSTVSVVGGGANRRSARVP